MILSIQIEKISEFLATLSPLMNMYKDGNYSFASRAIDWLEEAEKLMSSLRLKEGAEMSSLRAQILKAGDIAKDDHGMRTRGAIRRACCAAAADSVTRAESILRNRILQAEDKLNHFEEKLCEAVTAAVLVDCFTHSPREPRQQWLMKVWQELSQHNSIRPTTVYLATALLSVDRLYLLDKIMARLYESDAAVIHETPTPPLAN